MLAIQSPVSTKPRLGHRRRRTIFHNSYIVAVAACLFTSIPTSVTAQQESKPRASLQQNAIDIVYTNDLKAFKLGPRAEGSLQLQESRLVVTGRDPHIIFTLKESWLNSALGSAQPNQQLALPFHLTPQQSKPKQEKSDNTAPSGVKIELFFNVTEQANQHFVTNPWFRLVYSLPMDTDSDSGRDGKRLILSIPNFVELSSNTLLRLDIESCKNCVITLLENTQTSAPYSTKEALIAHRIMNGFTELGADTLSIAPNEWTLRNLKRSNRSLVPQTADAYMITPHLDLSMPSVAGLGITLSAYRSSPNGALSSYARSTADQLPPDKPAPELLEFQVFHSDNLHGFHDSASSQFKVWLSPTAKPSKTTSSQEQTESCEYRVFIPFAHTAKEVPHATAPLVLDQLRLDFPSDLSLRWRVCDAWLVPLATMSDEIEHQPRLLDHKRLNRDSGIALLKGSFTNLLRDWPFMIVLLLMVVFVVWRTVIAIKA